MAPPTDHISLRSEPTSIVACKSDGMPPPTVDQHEQPDDLMLHTRGYQREAGHNTRKGQIDAKQS